MRIIEIDEIKSLLPGIDLISEIEKGFVCYSQGNAVVPPVGELQLPKGEVHIKYGFIEDQRFYVIKIASGFYGNSELGLSSSSGCMLLFCQSTGHLKCILLDEGYLTDERTAVAGAIASKYFAPKAVSRIGIVGTGIQARAQLKYLASVTEARDVLVWGRSQQRMEDYIRHFANEGAGFNFRIEAVLNVAEIQDRCNLIVTTTPSEEPLLTAGRLKPGTHITAVGSDMPAKQELDTDILGNADIVVADSISQCQLRGEISHALRSGSIELSEIVELGEVISGGAPGRINDDQISVVDLTGVAVQDIQIASAVFQRSDQ